MSSLSRLLRPFDSFPPGWYAIPLRLVIGIGFLEHGYAKVVHGPENFAHVLQLLGVPAPTLLSWATIIVELLGGLAVLAGAFIPLVSIPLGIVMLVAMFAVHLPFGFSSIKLQGVTAAGPTFGPPGYETDLLYLAGLAALSLGSAGPLSVDGVLRRRRR